MKSYIHAEHTEDPKVARLILTEDGCIKDILEFNIDRASFAGVSELLIEQSEAPVGVMDAWRGKEVDTGALSIAETLEALYANKNEA